MRQDQIKYARERITAIRDERLEAAKKSCVVTPKTLTNAEKAKAIRTGDACLKLPIKLTATLEASYDFGDVPSNPVLNNDAYTKKAAPIRRRAAEIMDLLMLGDAAKALAAVQAYCKEKE